MTFADFGPFPGGHTGETNALERAKTAIFRAPPETPQSATTLGNPCKHAGIGEKKPTGDPVGFLIWWSWGDLNPRPQAFFEQIYMFSGLI